MTKKLTIIPARLDNTRNIQCENGKWRVAAYCRVSTDQEEQLGSFANQITYYTDYINEKEDYELAGIFADEGISGTGTRKRAGFRKMITACEAGKVDLVLTKSISRFARNTQDCLYYARYLKSMGIPVIFEKEKINTMEASGELLFTILSSLAQEESRNISENTQWGIRSKFRKGIPHLNTENFMGYDKNEDGKLIINPAQAQVVKRVFEEFLNGWIPSEIAGKLNKEGIPGIHGEPKWVSFSIIRMLQNEKYKGDILMQKYYVKDFLTGELERNRGELDQYYLEDDHEAIIEKEEWEAVQLELKRQENFRHRHQIRELGSCTLEPLYARVFCAACGGKYEKRMGKEKSRICWKCTNTAKKKGRICTRERVSDDILKEAVISAWNILKERRATYLANWEKAILEGNALTRLRARQLITLTERELCEEEILQVMRLTIEEIVVHNPTLFEIRFLAEEGKNGVYVTVR